MSVDYTKYALSLVFTVEREKSFFGYLAVTYPYHELMIEPLP